MLGKKHIVATGIEGCVSLPLPWLKTRCFSQAKATSFYHPFGMLLESYANASYDYSFGMNSQEKDNEIYGKGNSYTAEYWQYDARLGRRWNVDPVVAAWESLYAVNRNNPAGNSDKNGDCSTCPAQNISGNVSLRINLDGNNGPSGSIGFSFGASGSSHETNVSMGGGLSGSINFGGLGSSAHTPSTRFDLGITITGTYGTGTAEPQSLQTINSQMPSGIMNTFNSSATFGANVLLGSDNRFQATGYLGGRHNNISAGHSNDFFFGLSDQYWGAETNLKVGAETETNFALWNEVYNGTRYTSGPNKTENDRTGAKAKDWLRRPYDVMLVKQDERDVSLNFGRTHATLNVPLKTGGTFTIGAGGEGGLHMAPQRWLHYGAKYPQFEHNRNESSSFLITGYNFR